ncbi:MAG: recombinase family protein [Rubrobacter sp.]|nr:recombinase family protein [Rubrobacter sp.]
MDVKGKSILYARVSTEEQAKSGFSLRQQMERLREYAEAEGYEVLTEVEDPGQSGVSLERPGMDRVRDLVAAGTVSMVLAQDRDRFAREPAYLYLLNQEFAEHGCKMRALNDRGDGSPEGELTNGILDQLAKFERAKVAERSRRGKLRKAREGKIVGACARATYGFAFNEERDGYVIDTTTMPVVRRIFSMIGEEGMSINAVKTLLEHEGVPTPSGGTIWSKKTIREMILNDCFRAHTHSEIQALVSPDVATRLDPEKSYGVSWYGIRRTSVRQVAEQGPNGRRYRRRQNAVERPREEWIAVPVPDSGIPHRVADAAREAIKDNPQCSSAGNRFWELSGGVLFCGECGRRMTLHRRRKTPPRSGFYNYYRCPTRQFKGKQICPNQKLLNAEKVEEEVWEFVSSLLQDPERLRMGLDAMIEKRRKVTRENPEQEARMWLRKLEEVDLKRRRAQDLAIQGLLDPDELRAKLTELQETRETGERELEVLKGRREQIEQLEHDRDTVLETYATKASDSLSALTSEKRHQVYRVLRLRVSAKMDGLLEASGDVVVNPADVCSEERTYPRGRRAEAT